MNLTRRDWIKLLAATVVGTAATPAQLAAYEDLFWRNAEAISKGNAALPLARLSDVVLGFTVPYDAALRVRLYADNSERALLEFAINARATFRWVPAPETPIFLTPTARWEIHELWESRRPDAPTYPNVCGHAIITDAQGVLRHVVLDRGEGSLWPTH